jgi:hypothetical protein
MNTDNQHVKNILNHLESACEIATEHVIADTGAALTYPSDGGYGGPVGLIGMAIEEIDPGRFRCWLSLDRWVDAEERTHIHW